MDSSDFTTLENMNWNELEDLVWSTGQEQVLINPAACDVFSKQKQKVYSALFLSDAFSPARLSCLPFSLTLLSCVCTFVVHLMWGEAP